MAPSTQPIAPMTSPIAASSGDRLSPKARAAALITRYSPLVIALALFLGLSLHQLHLPGFYYDEALDLAPMLSVMRGEQPDLLRGIGVGRFPVMLLDYMGSLGGYVTIPFMTLFGSGYVAARMQPIFFSAVTIVLAWLLARRWFGYGVAAAAVLLLAVNPSFIWFSRQGISVTSVMTVFSLSSLLLLDVVVTRASTYEPRAKTMLLAFSAGLLIGLGLWAKFLFFRWIVVLVVIGIVFLLTRSREAMRSQSQKEHLRTLVPTLLIVLAGMLIGAAPLIYYNIVGFIRDGQPWTVSLLLNALTSPTQQFGVDNRDFFTNLRKSIDDVRVFVDGSYFWYNGVPFSNVFSVPALLIGAVVGGFLAIWRARDLSALPLPQQARRDEARRFFAVLAAIGALLMLGAFTVSGLWSTHQFIMLPLPQLIVACAAVWLAERIAHRVLRISSPAIRHTPYVILTYTLVCVLLTLPFARDLWVNEQHHATLAMTGGSGRFSDAIYKLSSWLDQNHIAQPVALDWGIEKNLRVLTGDRVRPVEIFGFAPEPDDAFRQRVMELLKDPARQYIVLWGGDGNHAGFAVYNRRQAFTDIASQMGRQVVEIFIAHEKSGLPVYVVLQAK